ncbi:MAG: hypothetical protein IKC75_04120 [Clostridia bacterium]|nr:hypothetical protein [Clostridia bacterium]
MRRLAFVTIFMLCLLTLFSCTRGEENSISFGEMGLLAAEIQTKEAGDIRVPSPAGIKANLCVGWQAKEPDGTVIFLPVGATYRYEAGESKKFTPVYFQFFTDSTASLIFTNTEHGICFHTTVDRSDWEALAALATSLSHGTLVLPTAAAQSLEALTHETVGTLPAGCPVADLSSDAWSSQTEDALSFDAPLTTLEETDYTTNYTALGYIKITYTDGSERYVYASYEGGMRPSLSFYSFIEIGHKFLSLETNTSTTLDLTLKNGGIGFTTTIPREKWDSLVNISTSISRGTLIYPTAGLADIGGTLTYKALEAAQKTAFDIPSTTWLGDTNGDMLSFGATLTEIAAYERPLAYTAVGYIKLTHADGSSTYIYAGFENDLIPSASVRDLASASLLDISDTESDYYKYPTTGGFSPYTEAERAKLDEISKFPILLIADSSVRGNRRLDENYLSIYNERIITDNDPTCAEEWHTIYQMLGDTIYSDGGALIITAKNGMALTENNISTIQINYGSRVGTISTYLFMDGALIIPYKVYSRPY